MSEYTPTTTREVKYRFTEYGYLTDDPDHDDSAEATRFDRWLAEHDAALIEKERASIRSTIGAYSGDPADAVDAFDAAVSTIEKARQRREEQP